MPTDKPPTAPNPQITAVMGLAAPLVQAFAAELVKLPPEQQTARIAKVLAAMRGEA